MLGDETMKNQFAKIVAVLMVLAMTVSVFGLCASAAETTTEANTTVLLGDVNLDGKVTIQDATLIQKAIAKLATLDEVQAAAAEVTEDGEVNIKDVTMIQKWIAKFDDVNENIGKPMATADEATPDQPGTPDQPVVDPSTPDQPATEDQPVVDPTEPTEPTEPSEPTPAKFYTVAGQAGLCGVEWDPSQNKMTDNGDGTWSITFTNIAAGTYEFKVVENGAWGNPDFNLEGNAAGGGANAKVTVEVDGSTVVIAFDGTKVIIESVTAPGVEDPTEPTEPATKDEPVVDPSEPATDDETVVDPSEPATDDETVVDPSVPATDDETVVDPEVPATEDEATVDEATTDEATTDEVAPVETKYYLCGSINGANYACEEDWENLGEYVFVDGKITVEFTSDSYLMVKDENNNFLCTDGWLGFNPTSAVMGNYENNNKFHVAAGTRTLAWDAETFTLTLEA